MQRVRNHDSPTAIQQFLTEAGLAPSRRFGQNFLVNPEVRRRIVELLEVEPEHSVWEIGPGLGAMSEELVDRCGRLSLFEIDRRFAGYLRELFAERRHTEVVEGDFLKTGKAAIEEAGLPDRVLGNLPYNAASQIIALLIEHGSAAGAEGEAKAEGAAERGRRGECRMVFTVQKEVGMRMMAKPGSREYSSFSVLCGLYAQVSDGGDVAAGSFYPAPKVVSRVVVVEPRLHFDPEVSRIAAAAARDAFAARRKTLRNALKSGALASRFGAALLMEALGEAGIDPDLRGETLSVERFASLARRIRAKEGKSQGSQP